MKKPENLPPPTDFPEDMGLGTFNLWSLFDPVHTEEVRRLSETPNADALTTPSCVRDMVMVLFVRPPHP